VDITRRQKGVLIGSILGDAYLEKKLEGGSSSFRFKQSEEKKEYVFWMHDQLKNLCHSLPKRGWNRQWSFNTFCNQYIDSLRRLFYRNKVKIVPKEIAKILTDPISLAVWFMDDGTIDYRPKDHYAFRIASYSFSRKENELLCNALKINFGIVATVQQSKMRNKVYYRIYIGEKGRDKFLHLIKPHIQSCLSHKLPPNNLTPQRLDLNDRSRVF